MSVVLVVFILLLFNLGGWFLWQVSPSRLDERLDSQLTEVGLSLRVYLDQLLQSEGGLSETSLLEAALYLRQVAQGSTLRRIFLFDRQGRVWFDSREEVEPGQSEPLLEADREQLDQLWAGHTATTVFYPTEEGHAKRAYVPLLDEGGTPQLGLALEAGTKAFAELERYRRTLRTLSLLSLAVGIAAVLVLVQVVRRARRMEEIVSRTERALEAGQLTAALAHELRNPLGIIHTNAEVLLEQVAPERRETVQDIIEESERLSSLIARFLDLSSQKPADWALASLGSLVEKVVARRLASLKASGITIELERPEAGDQILVQVDRMESVLDNLIANAKHALEAPETGKIRRIEVEVKAHRRSVEIEVRDSGPGFSKEALEMALQPFYSSRPRGTGLGLAIVRRIVEDHGGTLTLSNRPKGGASVRLEFHKAP